MERRSAYYFSKESAISLPAGSPQKIVKLDYSQANWVYAVREPAAVRYMFIQERRVLALTWLRLIRYRAALIIFYYRIYLPNPRPSDRVKLMGNYALFLSVWAALFFLIRCSNPIHFSKLAALALSRMGNLSADCHNVCARQIATQNQVPAQGKHT
ncbi:MAG: hypothetical protein L0220_34680 [Acidobacteria bacterium]|nr:hypothetical protein [Acidobacteriota bacterium]